MADNEAMLKRIHAQDSGTNERLVTPLAGCRRMDLPKVEGKDGALRAPRTAKVVMPFMDDMTDEAVAEMRKRLDADEEADPTRLNVTPRTA